MNKKITAKEVENCIEKNGNNKAPGPDEITNEMLKEGKELIKERLSEVMNDMKENNIEIPEIWKVKEIIFFYKRKGDYLDLSCQRGISLTSTVLKLLENIIKESIESEIRNKSTPLQGGGKKGKNPEEYIFIIQTIIDSNRKEGKSSKLIITDVEKAFDQAWRIGVFHNLLKRGIEGEILELMWKINNDIRARIKEDSQTHTEEFTVEESLRQGGCLSAILYGQHVGSVVEDLEKKYLGKQIGKVKIPAVAWQDDVTLIPYGKEEETVMIKEFERSTEKNRITLALEKKTKVLTIEKEDMDITTMKGKVIKETEDAKRLGYTFNSKGNSERHLEVKEWEIISMMANLGLLIKEANMDRIFVPSLLILYRKCFIPKILRSNRDPSEKKRMGKIRS